MRAYNGFMKKTSKFVLFMPAVLILVPAGAFSLAWENAVGAQFSSMSDQIKVARVTPSIAASAAAPAATPAERDEAAKKVLGITKEFDDLLGAAIKRGEDVDAGNVLKLAVKSGLLSEENNKAFDRLSEILIRENIDEIAAEADLLGVSIDVYRDSGKTPIWSGFMQKMADAKSKLNQLSPEQLFAEYFKYENRLTLQRGRFVADNQFQAEASLSRLKGDIFDKLGLSNIPR